MTNWLREAATTPPLQCGGAGPKACLVALAVYADDEGVCWPSIRAVALATGLSRATVTRSLAALRERGLIDRQHRFNEGGQTTSRFQLRIAKPAPTTEPSWPDRVREFVAANRCGPEFEAFALVDMQTRSPDALAKAWRTWSSRHTPNRATSHQESRIVDGVPLRPRERIGANGEIEVFTPGVGWGEFTGERRRRTSCE